MRKSLLLLGMVLMVNLGLSQGVPEYLYYKFDGSGPSVLNFAIPGSGTNPATIVGGHTQAPAGQFGNGLVGAGGSSATNNVNTGWPLNVGGADWTISFWIGGNPITGTTNYFFGDLSSASFRCFTGGVAGDGIYLRGGGLTDVIIAPADITYPAVVTYVYDAVASEVRTYIDGVFLQTTAQPGVVNLSGTSNFLVGGYGTANALTGILDEFRFYNRALSAAEVTATWNQPLPLVVGPIDLALAGLSDPVLTPGTCFGATETVTVTLASFGTDTLDFATNNAQITINAAGPNPQQFITTLTSGVMNPGTFMPVTLTTTYDMSAGGNYTFSGFVELITGGPDVNLANDTLQPATVTNFSVAVLPGIPYLEDFETFTAGPPYSANYTNGWTPGGSNFWYIAQSTGANINSLNTGPWFDNTLFPASGGKYAFLETSSGATGAESFIISPCIDLSGVTAANLRYAYHMYGAAMGSLVAQVESGGTWITVDSLAGEDQTAGGDPWGVRIASLGAFSGQVVRLRFKGIRGTSFTSDMSIDDIEVFEPAPFELELTDLLSPVDVLGACYSGAEDITVAVGNQGSLPVDFSVTPIEVVVNVTGPNPTVLVDTINTGTLAPGNFLPVTLSTTYSMAAGGTYTFDTYFGFLAGGPDANPGNDTLPSVVITNFSVAVLPGQPFVEDFETFTAGPPYTATYANGWTPGGNNFWFIAQSTGANINSLNTGPWFDNTLFPAAGGKYAFLESSSGATGAESFLVSPCLDLTGVTAATLRFAYHMYGATMGSLVTQVESGGSWVTLDSLAGEQQFSGDAAWTIQQVNLTPYVGQVVKIRFKGVRGTSLTSDMAVDDIEVFEPLAQDAGMAGLFDPQDGCNLSATSTLLLGIGNFGFDSIQGGLNLNWAITGPNSNTGSVAIGDTIVPGTILPVTLAGPFDFSTPGTYTITAWTSNLAGDLNTANDTAVYQLISVPVVNSFPYFEDFEGGSGGWREDAISSGSSWELGTPAQLVINGAASGTQAWMTGLTTNHLDNEQSFVLGPCFDFTNIQTPAIQLAVWWNTQAGFDGAKLESSIDDGLTWQTVGAIGDPDNWYNNNNTAGLAWTSNSEGWSGRNSTSNGSGGWVIAKNRLTGLGGQSSVLLRVAFGSNATTNDNGFAFDDVLIYEIPDEDVGVAEMVLPGSFECSSDSTLVEVLLQNDGTAPQTNIPVTVIISGPTPITLNAVFPGPLEPDSSATFVVGTFNSNAGGIFNLAAYTGLVGDTLLFNDTTYRTTEVQITPDAPQVVSDSVCATDSAQFMLMASSNAIANVWFDAPSGGNEVFVGDTFQTPFLTSSTTYWVEAANTQAYAVGAIDNNIGAGGGFPSGSLGVQGLLFDVFTDIVIDSVTVYVETPGLMTIRLRDATNTTTISSVQVNVPNGNFQASRIPVGMAIAPGSYRIDAEGSAVGQVYRNTAGAVYPYDIPGVMSITDNTFSAGYYYFYYNWRVSTLGCASDRVPVTASILPPVAVNLGPDIVACAGLLLNATTPGVISYVWNGDPSLNQPTLPVTVSGPYSVAVVNASGCTGADTIVVTVVPSPSVDLGPDTTACGSLTLDAGNPGATYQWSVPGATGQTLTVTQSGTYAVTVTETGCTDTDTIAVTVLDAPSVDLGPDVASCVPVPLDAGAGGTSYLWSTGETSQTISATPPATGSTLVTVVVTGANGCETADSVILAAGVPPVVDLGDAVDTCGTLVLDAGNPGATYLWNTGETTAAITATQSGTYAVTVTNADGCEATDSVDVTVTPLAAANFTVSNPNFDFTYDFINLSSPGTYTWDFGDGSPVVNDPNPVHTYLLPGTYQVTLIVENACGADTLQLLLGGVSIDAAFDQQVTVYPNPTAGVFYLEVQEASAGTFTVELTDALGRRVVRRLVSHTGGTLRLPLDLSSQAEGVYQLRVSDGTRHTTKRLIRE